MLPEGCYGCYAVGVLLFNFGDEPLVVKRGDRIAQLICENVVIPKVEEVLGSLDQTDRGSDGFGSDGLTA